MSDLTDAEIEAIIEQTQTDPDAPDIDNEAPPRRFKELEEMTPADHDQRRRNGAIPERAEYVAYRRAVLERHGLTDAGEAETKDLEAMTARDHSERKYGKR